VLFDQTPPFAPNSVDGNGNFNTQLYQDWDSWFQFCTRKNKRVISDPIHLVTSIPDRLDRVVNDLNSARNWTTTVLNTVQNDLQLTDKASGDRRSFFLRLANKTKVIQDKLLDLSTIFQTQDNILIQIDRAEASLSNDIERELKKLIDLQTQVGADPNLVVTADLDNYLAKAAVARPPVARPTFNPAAHMNALLSRIAPLATVAPVLTPAQKQALLQQRLSALAAARAAHLNRLAPTVGAAPAAGAVPSP
jgi:hypothetical protein